MTRSVWRGLCAAACLTVLAAACAAAVAPPAGPSRAAESLSGGVRITQRLPAGLTRTEHAALEQAGAYGPRPVKLLIVGDSIALTLGLGLMVGSRSHYGVTVMNHATLGCDLDPRLEIVLNGVTGPATPGCQQWRTRWPQLAARLRPLVVVIGLGRWEVADHISRGQVVHVGQPRWDAHVEQDLQQAIGVFQRFGAKVVLLTMPYVDPAQKQPDGQPWPENTPVRTRAFNALVDQVAAADPREVSVIDLNELLNPGGSYSATLDGVEVRWGDGIHIASAGGLMLQPAILPVIGRIGLQDEAASRAHA